LAQVRRCSAACQRTSFHALDEKISPLAATVV